MEVFDHLSPRLGSMLAEAQAVGFLGPAPLEDHVVNGLAFASVLGERPSERCVDLGSGGGVPALIVALALPELEVVCVDRGRRRCEFLEEAVAVLGLEERVAVQEGDAEVLAREPGLAATARWVTARSFGPAAVTAEAACRYLRVGGELVVSEPPNATDGGRWRDERLGAVGPRFREVTVLPGTALARCERSDEIIDERYPRRAAAVRKRPLF